MKIGDKVTYKTSDGVATGVIHGIRKVDSKAGPRAISYLIDTGKDNRVDEYVTAGKAKNSATQIA